MVRRAVWCRIANWCSVNTDPAIIPRRGTSDSFNPEPTATEFSTHKLFVTVAVGFGLNDKCVVRRTSLSFEIHLNV